VRNVPNLKANRYRLRNGTRASDDSYGNNGMFRVPLREVWLTVQASDGGGWDHVSVSLPYRTPTWEEMEYVRSLFFRDDECVMQLSVPRAEHVNVHDHTLHLWRPQTDLEIAFVAAQWELKGEEYSRPTTSPGVIPRPPKEMV
jgi:hypothetical protein